MAIINEIQAGRFNRYLTRLFNLTGVEASSPQVSPEIMPVISLWDDRPEGYFLGDDILWSLGLDAAGAAGFVARARVFNGGSTTLAIVEEIEIAVSTAMLVTITPVAIGSAQLAAPQVGGFRDFRVKAGTGSQVTVATDATLAAGNTSGLARFNLSAPAGAQPHVHRSPYILMPTSGIDIVASTVNVNFTITVKWRERPLETSER